MNTEYKKVMYESLETVHQSINNASTTELPSLVHAEIEIVKAIKTIDSDEREFMKASTQSKGGD